MRQRNLSTYLNVSLNEQLVFNRWSASVLKISITQSPSVNLVSRKIKLWMVKFRSLYGKCQRRWQRFLATVNHAWSFKTCRDPWLSLRRPGESSRRISHAKLNLYYSEVEKTSQNSDSFNGFIETTLVPLQWRSLSLKQWISFFHIS